MSSIAYVTDEEMLEYHRLCRNRTILFWRLASKRKIADFHKGDLLFFYSRPIRGRKKGLVGYAHYDSTKCLSLNQMWKQYGESTGYSSKQRLEDAIAKAAKGEIPKQMRCLYLTDVVFFLTPVYPQEFGIDFPIHLESYIYLDRSDSKVTVKILECARKHGIDLWSLDPNRTPDDIFRADVMRHKLAMIGELCGKSSFSQREKDRCRKLITEKLTDTKWERIIGSETDIMMMDRYKVKVAFALCYQTNDRDAKIRELYGKILLYKYWTKKLNFEKKVIFTIISDKEDLEVKELVEQINHA